MSHDTMNDYVQTPEGGRIRWMRPPEAARQLMVLDGKLYALGEATIDRWQPPEPPDAA